MKLIVDSGSTKTEWCLSEQSAFVDHLFTAGTNPFFQTEEEIAQIVSAQVIPFLNGRSVEAVHFYGAGCAFPEKNRIVEQAIQRFLPVSVEVNSDLLGAARALCQQKPGIACILGTGSNSCYYDGRQVAQQVSPLGFILGDEGSGAVLGKLLVGDCLKHQLPEPLCRKFMQQFQLTPSDILDRVYKKPFPNRFLASLSRFLAENLSEPSIYQLVWNSFCRFFERNVMQYPASAHLPIHFIGSIAYYYKEVLVASAESLHLTVGHIEQTPMVGLISYHR
ncbi:MAG: ATPase [Parabacteroides sp.]